MKIVQESIVASSIRCFCNSFFALIGISAAILIGLVVVGKLSNKTEVFSTASYKILSDDQERRDPLPASTPVLFKLDLCGVIGSKHLNADTICAQLDESRHIAVGGKRIHGILLYINTPGGLVSDSDIIYRALIEYKQRHQIPIYAYVDGLCASGGMYIASAADKIYASEVSLIGSIGALMQFMNFSETLNKLGIQALTLTEGNHKDDLNALRPWQKGEEDHYQALLHYYYERFLQIVTKARPISKQDLVEKYGARVFPALQAQDAGYIDQAGASLSTTLRELATAAVGEGHDYQFITIQTTNWVNQLLEAKRTLIPEIQGGFLDRQQLQARSHSPFFYLYDPTLSAAVAAQLP